MWIQYFSKWTILNSFKYLQHMLTKNTEVNGVALWANIDFFHPIDGCLYMYQKAPAMLTPVYKRTWYF